MNNLYRVAAVFCVMVLLAPARAQDTVLLWGDTHLHTAHSTDAYGSGNHIVGPDQAYRYAKGETVLHPALGSRIRIPRPLDFLVVADHSDYLGIQVYLQKDDPRLTSTPLGRRLQEMVRDSPGRVFRVIFGTDPDITPEQMLEVYQPIMGEPWNVEVDAADRHNEPGVFTAFAGWEWSSHENSRNLHRVIFTDADSARLKSFFPYSNLQSHKPEDLWSWLSETAERLAMDFIAIPHNSNMSDGLMFDRVDSYGRPFTVDYIRTRMRWEPVVEITQAKGTSEVHPQISPNDEFAGFEIFRRLFFAKEPVPSPADYVRYALLLGLELEDELGLNPYRYGIIGSSDIHTGLVTVDENDFHGAVARDSRLETRQAAPRNRPPEQSAALNAWELSASGLAGVWAAENSRQAITAAFKRKEVYATSGPRILLRVFAGFDFSQEDAASSDIAAIGYSRGVPMGGDLGRATRRQAPTLLIHAVKDSVGANLDRLQVIKGWLDKEGVTHEKVYDVAWSGERKNDDSGRLPAVGNTVDVDSATYTNTIGAPQLSTAWMDPDFDPDARAFYYVRAIEIPTPRHQVYDAAALEMDPRETGQVLTIQERAWSTPIWYTP